MRVSRLVSHTHTRSVTDHACVTVGLTHTHTICDRPCVCHGWSHTYTHTICDRPCVCHGWSLSLSHTHTHTICDRPCVCHGWSLSHTHTRSVTDHACVTVGTAYTGIIYHMHYDYNYNLWYISHSHLACYICLERQLVFVSLREPQAGVECTALERCLWFAVVAAFDSLYFVGGNGICRRCSAAAAVDCAHDIASVLLCLEGTVHRTTKNIRQIPAHELDCETEKIVRPNTYCNY